MINTDFSKLAGMLGIGYFLHTVSIPIIKQNKNQENNERDVIIGYFLVYVTYLLVGVLGSIGFIGTFFDDHYAQQKASGED
jgi:hypothetical protein